MNEYKVLIQSTPNPNALKFVVNVPVILSGNMTFRSQEEARHVSLAQKILELPHVKEVYFFDNYITVTQDGQTDWDELEEQIKTVIVDNIEQHNPDLQPPQTQQPQPSASQPTGDPDLDRINAILDEAVRPYLQMDGGDLQVLGLEGNVLKISYYGACGSCPSATLGTMKAIENLLREEFRPDIIVELAEV